MNIADDILIFVENLTLNLSKCIFSKEHLEYCGFIFSKARMKLSDSKINALRNAERLQDIKGIRSYLNMVNYLKRFIPDFSTLTYPLRQLAHKNTKFVWIDACKNDNKDRLQVISYLSRSLNTTEQSYSQLERECLSIVYACRRQRVYLFGRKFKIYSDNKALVNLLSQPSSNVPLQIECMILQLQGYDFEIENVKSQQNISEPISNHPDREHKLIESTIVDKYVYFVTSTAVPIAFTLEDITTATKQNKFLQILKQTLLNNELNSMKKTKQYDIENLKLLKQSL